jgi:hypothetical protein
VRIFPSINLPYFHELIDCVSFLCSSSSSSLLWPRYFRWILGGKADKYVDGTGGLAVVTCGGVHFLSGYIPYKILLVIIALALALTQSAMGKRMLSMLSGTHSGQYLFP